jgi:beta propeller repeat protein
MRSARLLRAGACAALLSTFTWTAGATPPDLVPEPDRGGSGSGGPLIELGTGPEAGPPIAGELLVKLAPTADPDTPDTEGLSVHRRTVLFAASPHPARVRAAFAARSARAPRDATLPDMDGWQLWRYRGSIEPTEAARRVAELPGVLHAEPNHRVRLAGIPDDTYAGGPAAWSSGAWGQGYPDLWGMANVRADLAWNLETGDPGLIVAVVDSGIDFNHEDLQGNLWSNAGEVPGNGIDDDGNGYVDDDRGWSFAYGNNDVLDRFWHGTHVSGIIGAVGNNARGVAGMMWQCKILPVKSFDDNGAGRMADIAAGIRYAADQGADVINMSFSFRGEPSQLLRDAVEYAHALGAVLVASAGNSNADIGDCNTGLFDGNPVSTPSCFKETIAVGGVDHLDVKTDTSNWGASIDVVAPGGDTENPSNNEDYKNVLSTRAANAPLEAKLTIDGSYYRNRGTSMAAAHVSGLAGLVLSRQPGIDADLVRPILQSGAADVGAPGTDATYGFGRIDAYAALQQADTAIGKPELIAWHAGSTKRVVPEGAPLPLTVLVRNAGTVGAGSVHVEVHDGDPDAGGVLLVGFTVPQIPAGTTSEFTTLVTVSGRGEHRLYVTVDPQDTVAEFFEENNRLTRPLDVYCYRFVESLVSGAFGPQDWPDVHDGRITWQDYRDSPYAADIYMFDIASGIEQRISQSDFYEEYAAINDDLIVWQDLREQDPPPGTWDIYYHDLSDGSENRVTAITKAEVVPKVYGDQIVWMDSRNGLGNSDIYRYDISTGLEHPVTLAPSNQEDPYIDGTRIVWEDWRAGNSDVYFLDLAGGPERGLVTHFTTQYAPKISGDLVIYEDYRTGNADIWVYDLATEQARALTFSPGSEWLPQIEGDFVVWQDDRNGGQWDIYLYDLFYEEERRVTIQLNTQRRPSISGRHIVWSDFRNADPATGVSFDILMATIDDFPVAPTGLTAVAAENGGVDLDWSDNLEPEGDLDGYAVYRSLSAGGPYERIATTAGSSFHDASVNGGTTYFYRVTARDVGLSNLDQQQGESPYSQEASATAGGPGEPPPRSASGSPRLGTKDLEPKGDTGGGGPARD